MNYDKLSRALRYEGREICQICLLLCLSVYGSVMFIHYIPMQLFVSIFFLKLLLFLGPSNAPDELFSKTALESMIMINMLKFTELTWSR